MSLSGLAYASKPTKYDFRCDSGAGELEPEEGLKPERIFNIPLSAEFVNHGIRFESVLVCFGK